MDETLCIKLHLRRGWYVGGWFIFKKGGVQHTNKKLETAVVIEDNGGAMENDAGFWAKDEGEEDIWNKVA